MAKIYELLATGFEEIEAVVPADLLRRAGIEVELVSITGELVVTGAHDLTLLADSKYEDTDFSDGDMLLLPGGQPGTTNIGNHDSLREVLKKWNQDGKRIAAICAAPTVLGRLGLLEGKRATCYPGLEEHLIGAVVTSDLVVTDGNITTSRGAGTAIEFADEIIRRLIDEKVAEKVVRSIVYKG